MRRALASVSIGLFIATAEPAHACSCIGGLMEDGIRDSTIVFRGRQIAVTPTQTRTFAAYVLTFEVYEAWRGVDTRTIDFVTGSGGGDCGLGKSLGPAEVLVLSDLPKKPGRLPGVWICRAPIPVERVRDEIAALGPGVRPDRPSSRGWVGGGASFALAALP